MSKMILNEELVVNAVELARPSANAILSSKDMVWGPKWVAGLATGPGLKEIYFDIGDASNWRPKWGTPGDFAKIASKKLESAKREKASTSLIVAIRPWCFQTAEYLYAGGVYEDDIIVVISGARAWADEAIARIIMANIRMLAFMERDLRIKAEEMQI